MEPFVTLRYKRRFKQTFQTIQLLIVIIRKVKIRKKWLTSTLENSESIIRTLEWTEDALKRIRIEIVKSTKVKHRNPNVRVVVQSM